MHTTYVVRNLWIKLTGIIHNVTLCESSAPSATKCEWVIVSMYQCTVWNKLVSNSIIARNYVHGRRLCARPACVNLVTAKHLCNTQPYIGIVCMHITMSSQDWHWCPCPCSIAIFPIKWSNLIMTLSVPMDLPTNVVMCRYGIRSDETTRN
jgi:hypothetical protein